MSHKLPSELLRDELFQRTGISRRRLFATGLSLATGALAARFGLSSIAQAQTRANTRRRFIFAYFPGGWDQLLFLDPRDPERDNGRFADSNRGITLTETRYNELEGYGYTPRVFSAGNLSFGPAANRGTLPERLRNLAPTLSIVRGINMGTLAHEAGYRYMLTGKTPAGGAARGSSVAVSAAAQMNASTPLPVLSVLVESYNDHYPGQFSAVQAQSVDDLLLILERTAAYTERPALEDALNAFRANELPCEVGLYDRRGLLTRINDSHQTARNLFSRRDAMGQSLAGSFRALLTDMDVRSRYGFSDANAPGARAAFAAHAIKTGISQCVSVAVGNSTDTHLQNSRAHADLLYPGIAGLVALIEDLASAPADASLVGMEGTKWIDHTTIVAFSEFSRTPLFNQFGGRDHHLSGSVLLAGAGIRGGRVVGASSTVGMAPVACDLATGVPDESNATGELITPGHIASTLLASAGLDYSETRVSAIEALLQTS